MLKIVLFHLELVALHRPIPCTGTQCLPTGIFYAEVLKRRAVGFSLFILTQLNINFVFQFRNYQMPGNVLHFVGARGKG